MTSSAKLMAGAVLGGAALILTACGGGGSEQGSETVTQTVTSAPASDSNSSSSSKSSSAATSDGADSAQPASDDPVFAAIGAVLAAHPGGIISDVDREDDRDTFEMDVVANGQVVEVEVDGAGNVREDEREGDDDDDVRDAQVATVTAAEAIGQALEQHAESVLDELELDHDNGRLTWHIELDDADRRDLTELAIPAN